MHHRTTPCCSQRQISHHDLIVPEAATSSASGRVRWKPGDPHPLDHLSYELTALHTRLPAAIASIFLAAQHTQQQITTLPHLEQQGNENASMLWRELREQGFTGGYKMVNIWLREYLQKPGRHSSSRETARRQLFLPAERAEHVEEQTQMPLVEVDPASEVLLEKPLPSPRRLAWLLVKNTEHLSEQERQVLSFICQERVIQQAYLLAQQFVPMVRHRQADHFDSWLRAGLNSGIPDVQTFTEGLQKDYAAVKAALSLAYSNGPVEDQVNRLKFIKRSMYGRGSFELLRQRVLHAP